jgi:DNA-binding beta-propeller fold protein YncE
MARNRFVSVLVLLLSAIVMSLPAKIHAAAELTPLKELDLKARPLDVATAPDGQKLFVLTPGEILVYSVPEGAVTDRIPVAKDFDRIAFSPQGNTLILTSSTKNILKTVLLDFIYDIDITGLPVKGPKEAPVTIAVFSDYQ